jgi:hypothetical protein
MTTVNSGAKERLVKRLLEGSHDIFEDFIVVGLEDSLETICKDVERLLRIKKLSDGQWTDLNELHHDGMATIRVLKYHSTNYYTEQSAVMNKAWDKLRDIVF